MIRSGIESLEDRRLLTFSAAVDYPVGQYPDEVVSADFNNDGILDLAAAYAGSSLIIPDPGTGAVGVRLGNGDGTFGSAINSAVGSSPTSLAVGDFNGDGRLDLVTGDYNYGGTPTDVTVLLGNGDGSFQRPATIDLIFPDYFDNGVESVAVGDFNADGKLDILAVANVYGVEFLNYDFSGVGAVLLGTGTGTFEAPLWSLLNPSYTTSTAVDDFNGDGKLDIASVSDGYYGAAGYLTVSLGNGDGTFGFRRVISDRAGNSVIASDLNNDGNVDLATKSYYNFDGSYGGPAVFLGTGTGSFGTPQVYNTGYGYNLAAADFNGDGKLDLIASSYPDTVIVLLGDDAGAFTPTAIASVGSLPVGVAVGDFNGDGLTDAVTANNASNNVSVLLNDGVWDGSQPVPSITINDVTVSEGNTGTTSASFTVTLSAAYGQPVTVNYSTADDTATAGSDYQSASGTLTFAPGETTKTITVPIIGDRVFEPTETFTVNLSSPTNATIADGQGVGIIVDDEPQISISDVTKKEGNGKGKNATTLFTFTVTLSAAYDQAVTVNYATADGTATVADNDYVAASGTLTFAPGETTKTITVVVKGDKKKESNETFFINLFDESSNALLLDPLGIGTILNDDR